MYTCYKTIGTKYSTLSTLLGTIVTLSIIPPQTHRFGQNCEFGKQDLKLRRDQSFGKAVCQLVFRWGEANLKCFYSHSTAPLVTAQYSLSVLDLDTTFYFEEAQ